MMKKQIFRKEALERMGSPEQLDQLMTVTSPRGWIALAAIGLALLLVILWSIFGKIATTVDGDGVLVRLGGVHPVTATYDGAVADVFVHIGDTVRPGQQLARLILSSPDELGSVTPIVKSPVAGRILDIAVFEGSIVNAQSILLTIESTDRPLQAIVYVPASEGYPIQANMKVQIMPATAKNRSVRYLHGFVQSAGKLPVSQADVVDTLQNAQWATSLLNMGPVLEVIAGPGDTDWPSHLYSGTPCQARITVNEQRPIEFVLPILSRRRGD